MKKLEKKRDTTTIRVERGVLQKMRLVALMDHKTPTQWIEWVVNMAHQCIRQPKKKVDPFREWGKKGITPKADLPPGYSSSELE